MRWYTLWAFFIGLGGLSLAAVLVSSTLLIEPASGVDFPERVRESASIVRDTTERKWVDERTVGVDSAYLCTTVDAPMLYELTSCTARP